jgi:pimeloyl-ACP methyl ester carboxylesterase
MIWLNQPVNHKDHKDNKNAMIEDILAGGSVRLTTRPVTVSDGVTLTLYDFQPANDTGAGPVLVFVPGWVSLISGWTEVLKVLTPKVRVLYLETREKRSARLPEGPLPAFTLERMSADLAEVIGQELPEETPYALAGSSLGSAVILDYLNDRATRLPRTSVLISPITEVDFPLWARLIIRWVPPSAYAVIKHIAIFYLTRFRVDKRREPEQAAKYTGTLMAAEPVRLKANARALSGYSVWNRLAGVDARVLLVGARTDRLHGLDALRRMAETLPQARLSIMESNRATHSAAVAYLLLDELTL